MLTTDLQSLRAQIDGSADHLRLVETLRKRAARVLERMPPIPVVKALLSRDGGVCPTDGTPLRFDPWNAETHRCPRCGGEFTGIRHHRHWARAQHLWLAERMAELATLGVVAELPAAVERVLELQQIYEALYHELSNRDNVLGPSHLFFSTYLESVWVTSYLAAASLLRDGGVLPDARVEGINRIADEAALVIGEFNEGMSNRQTWHSAALVAIATWFQDEDLARSAVESHTGLLGHLTDGFGADGLWWEGENYHLFALRGLLQGLWWARAAGFDLLEDPALRAQFRSALLATSLSALPDCTFPARRDSRFGVSLAQPAYLELWEIGGAWLGADEELGAWLAELYARPAPPAEHYDAWLHESGRPTPAERTRSDLSWWALLEMGPTQPTGGRWRPESVLLADQGIAVLRQGGRYVSLECGPDVGGHSHPDRLHLTLHAGGVHWLPDLGTGSYVVPELAWYRSALAHNAPRVDGLNAGGADAWCEAFESGGGWAWARGRAGVTRRTVVTGPHHLLDIVEIDAPEAGELDLPWHLQGDWRIETPGRWETASLEHPFVRECQRFVSEVPGPVVVISTEEASAARLRVHLTASGGELLRATAPGIPTSEDLRQFLLLRIGGSSARWVTVVDWATPGTSELVDSVQADSQSVTVLTGAGPVRYLPGSAALTIEAPDGKRTLSGARPAPLFKAAVARTGPRSEARALAPRVVAAPALDGTLDGFDTSHPLHLEFESQYRRSEEPYDAEEFSAEAWLNWDEDEVFLAVQVRKRECIFRDAGAPPLDLDNESEDLHSDGLQVYLRGPGRQAGIAGVVLVPQPDGTLASRRIGTDPEPALYAEGRWATTDTGYLVTVKLRGGDITPTGGASLGFDVLVNEMRPERLRRAGQLVWSGGGGWVYLRGDRPEPGSLGTLELA